MAQFRVGTPPNSVGLRKMRGLSPLSVLRTIFESAFFGRNIYTGVNNRPTTEIGKDAVYRIPSFRRHNRRRLVGSLDQAVIKGVGMLTLGRSDGAGFIRVDHAMLSSTKQKNPDSGNCKGDGQTVFWSKTTGVCGISK